MAYTTPPTFIADDPLAAADLNILGDDLEYLKAITDGLTFSGTRETRSAATSISNATWTAVSWSAEVYDYGGWYSAGTDIVVPAGAIPAGFTTISVHCIFNASFAANGTGYRGIRLLVNGSSQVAQTIPGFASDTAIIVGTGYVVVEAGDILTVEVYQNSGGALNASSMQLVAVRFQSVA